MTLKTALTGIMTLSIIAAGVSYFTGRPDLVEWCLAPGIVVALLAGSRL